jgi:hypothetical protein
MWGARAGSAGICQGDFYPAGLPDQGLFLALPHAVRNGRTQRPVLFLANRRCRAVMVTTDWVAQVRLYRQGLRTHYPRQTFCQDEDVHPRLRTHSRPARPPHGLFPLPTSAQFYYTPARLKRIVSQLSCQPQRRGIQAPELWNDRVFTAFRAAGTIFVLQRPAVARRISHDS